MSGVLCERRIAARVKGKISTCCDVRFGDGGTDTKTEGQAGRSRVEDVFWEQSGWTGVEMS